MEIKKKKLLVFECILCLYPIAFLFSNVVAEFFLFVVIGIFISDKKNLKLIFEDKIFIFLFIFFIYLIINFLINFENKPSVARTFGFIRFPLFVISVAYLINHKTVSLRKIFSFWSVILLIIFLDIFIQKIFGSNLLGYKTVMQGDNLVRLGGFMNQELKIANLINHFSMLTVGYFFSLQAREDNKYNSIFALLLMLVAAFSVFLTAERANFITILIAIFILSFFKYKISRLAIVSAVFLFALTFFQSNNTQLLERMILERANDYNVIFKTKEKLFFKKDSHYFAHYSVANQIFKRNPVFGNGLNNFQKDCVKNQKIYIKEVFPGYTSKMCNTHPHSFYLEILSELGIVGFFLLVAFFIYFFYKLFLSFALTKKNYLLISGGIILFCYFIPVPRGSFFTNWTAMIFWLTFAVVYSQVLSSSSSK